MFKIIWQALFPLRIRIYYNRRVGLWYKDSPSQNAPLIACHACLSWAFGGLIDSQYDLVIKTIPFKNSVRLHDLCPLNRIGLVRITRQDGNTSTQVASPFVKRLLDNYDCDLYYRLDQI